MFVSTAINGLPHLINKIANLLPVSFSQASLQPLASEWMPPQAVRARAAFRKSDAQGFLYDGPKRLVFLNRLRFGLFEQIIGNIDGCFHMANHTVVSGQRQHENSAADSTSGLGTIWQEPTAFFALVFLFLLTIFLVPQFCARIGEIFRVPQTSEPEPTPQEPAASAAAGH
jgi:hypothetical protein